MSIGKNIKLARSRIDKFKKYSFVDAVDLLKQISYVKFDQTFELILNLGTDRKRSDQIVRGVVNMPCGTGKVLRIAVICKEERFDEAKNTGADLVGCMDIIEQVKLGQINFDVCIATPDVMGLVGQVAKILGPKGLMPNPKVGTVTNNIIEAVSNCKMGQVEFRSDKGGVVHAGIGKMSFSSDDLIKNSKELYKAILKAKPAGVKGMYIKSAYLGASVAPSLNLEISSLE